MTKLTYTEIQPGDEGQKRQHFPYIITSTCPGCKQEVELDLMTDYISHPEFGEVNEVIVYCEECDEEIEVEVIPRLTLDLEGIEEKRTTIRESITIDRAVATLNRLLEADEQAITKLCEHSEPCNQELSNDPEAIVCDNNISMLGVINALFGNDERTKFGGISRVHVVNEDGATGALLEFTRTRLQRLPDAPR